MLRLVLLTFALLMLNVSAGAKTAGKSKPAAPSKQTPAQKMNANLLNRCDDGIAAACYDYGKSLLSARKVSDRRKAKIFIRRACTLAYAPACVQHSTVVAAKTVKDNAPKKDENGKPCTAAELAKGATLSADGRSVAQVAKGSLWEQSGVQAGDQVVSVNGQPFTDPDQVGAALEKGGAVLNVLRNGRETSVMVNCP